MEKLEAGNSTFVLDPNRGCQWLELSLCPPGKNESISIIKGFNSLENFFGSGCFLMFPWVNRMWPNQFWYKNDSPISTSTHPKEQPERDLEKNEILEEDSRWVFDEKGYPLHGLVHSESWKKTEIHGQYVLDCSQLLISNPTNPNENRVKQFYKKLCNILLFQTFTLSSSKLVVELKIKNNGKESFDFGMGWHPYIKLPFGRVDEWEINFLENLQEISLDENLLPNFKNLKYEKFENDDKDLSRNFSSKNNELYMETFTSSSHSSNSFLSKHFKRHNQLGAVKLDNLYQFNSKSRIQIAHPSVTFALEIESNSQHPFEPMKYWQIYTPDDRQSLAIEPMSAPGNFENIQEILTNRIDSQEEKKFQFSISLRMKNAL
ncbi:aldose epimerase family protein [Leptospira sp. GIMC2001]|uniref:aldose epimerase family protein n=1 Tax=Leptospira sp. GIMC2001 TaxID=1513297 RepID=UPI00234B3317|nr:hypothetical protein [Leptospira sp. GIMC2001]WCL48670.1 hypothetical protein O4O04_15365 [Leptospira sp. GIMC2001]